MSELFQRDGKHVPVVAFFGTKGGVGKTTIARSFAEHITRAASAPNVLVIDVDVHNRGMTVEMTRDISYSCNTVHDYIASRNVEDVKALDVSGNIKRPSANGGKLYFIPASTPEADHVFDQSAQIGTAVMKQVLTDMIDRAVQRYRCDCVIIDCGPIIDPYTSTGAVLADWAFIIGQNEPISFSNVTFYPGRIREFYPEFSQTKMKLIVNKVRGWEALKERGTHQEVFAAIPFTMDIVDASEGLSTASEMQMLLFEDNIAQVVERVFKNSHPKLVPSRESLLPERWESLVSNVDALERSPAIKRLSVMKLLLPLGILACLVGGVVFYSGSTVRKVRENTAMAAALTMTIESQITEAQARNEDTAKLEKALQTIETATPANPAAFRTAVQSISDSGIQLPAIPKQDMSQENTGIGVIFGGVIIALLGGVFWGSCKRYLTALHGIRKGGTKWLMSEMQARPSSRKALDDLLKMADKL